MLHDRTAVVEAVCESLTRSDLYPALASRVTLLGMRFGAEGLLFRLNPFNTNVYADFLPDWLPVKPNAWLTIAEADILAYASTGRPIPSFDLELPSTRGGPPDARPPQADNEQQEQPTQTFSPPGFSWPRAAVRAH